VPGWLQHLVGVLQNSRQPEEEDPEDEGAEAKGGSG
jgi:hypothetical protein